MFKICVSKRDVFVILKYDSCVVDVRGSILGLVEACCRGLEFPGNGSDRPRRLLLSMQEPLTLVERPLHP